MTTLIIDDDVAAAAHFWQEDQRLLQAIVQAEGNIVRAVQISVPSCLTRADALIITCRSLAHRRRDYITHLQQTSDFLAFFAAHWAPRGAANDPHDLNAHWLDNVRTLARIA